MSLTPAIARALNERDLAWPLHREPQTVPILMAVDSILWLGQDYSDYTAAYYQKDLFRAVTESYTVVPYGRGFDGYDRTDTIHDILSKTSVEPDLIVVSNTWGSDDVAIEEFSRHGDLRLDTIDIQSLMFLNKEYRKIDRKLEFIQRNGIEYVTTVLKDRCAEWSEETGSTFIWKPFGIDLDRFSFDPSTPDVYDFGFSGNLHTEWLDERQRIKEHIFKPRYRQFRWWHNLVHTRRFRERYDDLAIYWGERQNRDLLLRSRAPHGESYVSLLNKCRTFLNTRSALGIVNTRFWELMATKSLIICPTDDYFGLLTDGRNCVMYDDLDEFDELLNFYASNDRERIDIVQNAYDYVSKFTWETIFSELLDQIEPI